jgi:glutathione-regulated potassium-efflux system ancillary protein KefC/glutathione-regulated potassium-efflux system protein KefB
MSLLAQAAIFLAAAVLAVPLFRRLKLGAVLGYLAAGVIIGPWALRLVTDVESILHFAELGVVLLLFVIGLELQPSRLWVLRKAVFGLGGAQVALTGAVLAAIALALGQSWQSALVMGLGLAMSSTAFVLQLLAERRQLTARHGRSAFAILLFQDLSVIPLLALIPLLSSAPAVQQSGNPWLAAGQAVAVIAAVILGGRVLLRPVLRVIAESRIQEIFTAAALLVVIGVSLLMVGVGLSMSLGAFLAGVLLADSEYRHELEANIEPFKGLLLGLFFISVGMAADVGQVLDRPLLVLAGVIGLMGVKAAVLYVLGRLSRHSAESSRALAASLCQGGEFAFVLFALAEGSQVMDRGLVDLLVVVVTLSMAATPLALLATDIIGRRLRAREPAKPFDTIDAEEQPPVIIAGFGRVGQIVSRILLARGIPITALDIDPAQVETVRQFGRKVYYGDASRLDLLQAAGTEKAKLFVLAVDNVEKSLLIAETLKKHFPHVKVFARARNRFHAYRLMDIGVEYIMRETLLSSLQMAEEVLQALGAPAWQAREIAERFRLHDERILQMQHAVYHDETQLRQTSREAMQELDALLRGDREDAQADGARHTVFSPSDIR